MSHAGERNDTSIEQSFFQCSESSSSIDRTVNHVPFR